MHRRGGSVPHRQQVAVDGCVADVVARRCAASGVSGGKAVSARGQKVVASCCGVDLAVHDGFPNVVNFRYTSL